MKLYRFVDWAEEPWLEEFDVIRCTKCGYWIMDTCKWPEKKRWISKDGHYAHKTKEEALKSYIVRKEIQLKHIERKKEDVLRFIEHARTMDFKYKLLACNGDF